MKCEASRPFEQRWQWLVRFEMRQNTEGPIKGVNIMPIAQIATGDDSQRLFFNADFGKFLLDCDYERVNCVRVADMASGIQFRHCLDIGPRSLQS